MVYLELVDHVPQRRGGSLGLEPGSRGVAHQHKLACEEASACSGVRRRGVRRLGAPA